MEDKGGQRCVRLMRMAKEWSKSVNDSALVLLTMSWECWEKANAERQFCLPADGFNLLPVDPPGRLLGDDKAHNQVYF